jgi:hypothetical protein
MSVSINGTNGLTFNDGSAQTTAASGFGFKNRLINGNMVIDQRNAGASVTGTANLVYNLDRYASLVNTDGVMTFQRVADAPTGFTYSLKATTTTADASLSASQRAILLQRIEGFNSADLMLGSASAVPFTLSFWVKSTLTGTFGGAFQNNDSNRAYPFTYTISAANTWEQKTVTITGDTTGTWNTTTGTGLQICWGLGVGSTYSATAGSWQAGDFNSATGGTSVIGTLNATWQVTGVQLEKGSTATSFDYRPYGTELALCQRYFQKSYNIGTAVGTATTDGQLNHNFLNLGNYGNVVQRFGVCMRASPTMTVYDGVSGASGTIRYWNGSADTTRTTNFALSASEQQLNMADDTFNHTNIIFQWTASAEL